MTQTGLAPRRAALDLLEQVTGEGLMLSEALASGTLSRLPAEDRARAQRIAVSTLRGLNRADRMLKPFIERNPPRVVRNILRIGVVEIWSGEAAHGVVNSCVELAGRDKKTAGMKGLINAVLRKVAAERPGAWDRLPVPRLPDWLRLPLIEAWGKEAVAGMEASHFAGPALDLTARTDPAAVAKATGGTLLPTGSVRLAAPGQVTALPGYESGDWWVQDAAAALPARLLAPRKGEKVLDLCAAPGGKTMQIAAIGRAGDRARHVRPAAGTAAPEPDPHRTAGRDRGRRCPDLRPGRLRRHPARCALFGHRHHPPPPRSAACQGWLRLCCADRAAGRDAGPCAEPVAARRAAGLLHLLAVARRRRSAGRSRRSSAIPD